MECLSVPVDHRLIGIIKRVKCHPHNDRSSHLRILDTFSRTAKRKEKPITEDESHLTTELAGPDTKGGVLVTLLRPPRNQCFDQGYSAEVSRCRTTNAVADLINTATNQQLTIDDVSVFDTLPYSPEGSDDDQLVREAEATFSRMVKTKKPDVILCCYQGNSSDNFVNRLRSIGVGKVFRLPGLKISSDCEVQRINAFHPSYAVNYNATYSCFRRLLLLEFTQAFYQWTEEWQEEPWMETLRSHCITIAQQIRREQDMQANGEIGRRKVIRRRWESINNALNSSFSTMEYFRLDISSNEIQKRLTESNISWHCADAYLFLEKFGDVDDTEDYASILLSNFHTWCEQACMPAKPKVTGNKEDSHGYFNHRYLTEAAADISDHFTRRLQSCFLSLLKDLNLSFRKVENDPESFKFEIQPQKDAFFRFSQSLERESSKNRSIREGMQNLGIH